MYADLQLADTNALQRLNAYFYVVKYLPAWFPGGYWQRKLPYWKALAQKAISAPFEAAQDAMVRILLLRSLSVVCTSSDAFTGPRRREARNA